MTKKLLTIFLLITFIISPVMASDLGNTIKTDEYPESNMVLPNKDELVIEGGVAKYIDVNLEDCLKFALGNNPKIQAAIQDVFASDYRIKQAWSGWFPTISWQTGYTRIKQLQLSDVFNRNLVFNYYVLGTISVSEMLYDFGVTQNRVTISKLENEQFKIILTETVNTVIRDVKTAYYGVLLANEQERVAEETVEQYQNFYEQAKAFYQAGTNPKIDMTIAEVNLSSAKLALIQAQNAVDIAMAKLNNAMGLPYMNKYNILDKLKYNPCNLTLTQAVDIAKEARPDYKLSEVKVQSANQNVKLTKKAWYPTLEFDGNYSIGGRSFTSNYGYNIGAYLNFPQINGMLIRNQIKEAQSMHTKEIANSHSTQNDIYLEIQNAFYSLIEKKNQIPVSTLQVKQAKENYDLSFGRYKVGVGNPVELKEAQVQYANARVQYYNTLYEFNTARANLEKAIGKNIVDGSVELKKDDKVVSKDVKAEQIKSEQTSIAKTQQSKKVRKEKVQKNKVCKSKSTKPAYKTRHYKNKIIRSLHNFFSYPDD